MPKIKLDAKLLLQTEDLKYQENVIAQIKKDASTQKSVHIENIDYEDSRGFTFLFWAIEDDDTELVEILLREKADYNKKDGKVGTNKFNKFVEI